MDVKLLKQEAAEKAVEFVQSGMVVGLGHGTTTIFALRRLAELIKTGKLTGIVGVPCSRLVEQEGSYSIRCKPRTPGIYYYRLIAGKNRIVQKAVTVW